MCTVTLTPLGKTDFVLYSNRDEAPFRVSTFPEFYSHNDTQLLYPKDVESGGTWIGLSERQHLICLLNGGFEIHERKAEYRHSRGIVVKDLLSCNSIVEAIEDYDLKDIEPFTMIIVDWQNQLEFYELVWDGIQKHFKVLEKEPHIWSSSTLYDKSMRTERRTWFENFKSTNELNVKSLSNFHTTAGKGNDDYGVIMNRGFVKTTSITRVEKQDSTIKMVYNDLATNSQSENILNQVPAN